MIPNSNYCRKQWAINERIKTKEQKEIDRLQKEFKDLELAYGLYKDSYEKLQKELEQEKERNNRQLEIDTAEEVLKWKGKYHLLSRKINGVLEDKIKDKIKEYEEELKYEITKNEAKIIIRVLEELLEGE